jgi:hypothetical protein
MMQVTISCDIAPSQLAIGKARMTTCAGKQLRALLIFDLCLMLSQQPFCLAFILHSSCRILASPTWLLRPPRELVNQTLRIHPIGTATSSASSDAKRLRELTQLSLMDFPKG